MSTEERFTDADVELVSDATERHHITDRTDAMGHNACACDNWWDSADMEGWDEHMATVTLRALADAGRLLPPGGVTSEERGWLKDGQQEVVRHWSFVDDGCAFKPLTHVRSVTDYPDGSRYVGAWRPLTDEGTQS